MPRLNRHPPVPSQGLSANPTIKTTTPLKDSYQNQQWNCRCNPSRRAVLLRVNGDTPNRGRHYWACEHNRCRFFKWEADVPEDLASTGKPMFTQTDLHQWWPQSGAPDGPENGTPSRRPRAEIGTAPGPAQAPSASVPKAGIQDTKTQKQKQPVYRPSTPPPRPSQQLTTPKAPAGRSTSRAKRMREPSTESESTSPGPNDAHFRRSDAPSPNPEMGPPPIPLTMRPQTTTVAGQFTPVTGGRAGTASDSQSAKRVKVQDPQTPTPGSRFDQPARVTADPHALASASRPGLEYYAAVQGSAVQDPFQTSNGEPIRRTALNDQLYGLTPNRHGATAPVRALLRTPRSASGIYGGLEADIMPLLAGQGIDESVLVHVREILSTFARRTAGEAQGKQSVRDELARLRDEVKTRDEKLGQSDEMIERLQQRVIGLQNQLREREVLERVRERSFKREGT